jgi:hypothetical protein
MSIKHTACSILLAGCVAGLLTACATEQAREAKLAAQAKVTRADAEKIALSKVPGGTIKEGGIEKEKGKLIWSFDITTPGSKDISEVAVDALTGAVIAVDKESPEDEAREKKADEKEEKK